MSERGDALTPVTEKRQRLIEDAFSDFWETPGKWKVDLLHWLQLNFTAIHRSAIVPPFPPGTFTDDDPRFCYGAVASDGSIIRPGSGDWTVTAIPPNKYRIDFNEPFDDPPVAVAMANNQDPLGEEGSYFVSLVPVSRTETSVTFEVNDDEVTSDEFTGGIDPIDGGGP